MLQQSEFDGFADDYEAQHRANIAVTGEGPEYFARYKVDALARLVPALPAAPAILDFGSGIGNSIPHLRAAFPDAALACADVSRRSIDLSRRRHPGPERYLLVEDDAIPADDESFDLVFTACVFHHIPHEAHEAWLRELLRVTRTGGSLVVFEHNPWNPLTVRAVDTCPFDVNARLIAAPALARRAAAAGWSRPRVRNFVFFPRALAALRRLEPALAWLPLGGQYALAAVRR